MFKAYNKNKIYISDLSSNELYHKNLLKIHQKNPH